MCLCNSTGPRAQSSNCGVPSCCIAISRRQTSSSKDASRCDECRASVGKVILSNQPHSIAFYSSHHQGLPVKYAAVPFGSTFSKQEIACIATYQVRQREKKTYRSNLSHRDERSLAYLVLAALTDSLPFLPHSRAEIHLMLTFLHFFKATSHTGTVRRVVDCPKVCRSEEAFGSVPQPNRGPTDILSHDLVRLCDLRPRALEASVLGKSLPEGQAIQFEVNSLPKSQAIPEG